MLEFRLVTSAPTQGHQAEVEGKSPREGVDARRQRPWVQCGEAGGVVTEDRPASREAWKPSVL